MHWKTLVLQMLKNGSLKFLDNLCSQREKLYFQPTLTTQKLYELLPSKKAQSQQPTLSRNPIAFCLKARNLSSSPKVAKKR
jgi:hypothetical protein